MQPPRFAIRTKVLHDLKLSLQARLAYMLLDDLAWKDGGEVAVRQDELADRLGVPRRSLERYLRELREAHYVEVRQQGPGPAVMVLVWKRSAMGGEAKVARSAMGGGTGSPPVADLSGHGLGHAHMGNTKDKQIDQIDRSIWTRCECGGYHACDGLCSCRAVHRQERYQRLDTLQETREMLASYVRSAGLAWPSPDDEICQRVLAAASGHLQDLYALLKWLLLDRRLTPSKSYAWFETVVGRSLRRRPA